MVILGLLFEAMWLLPPVGRFCRGRHRHPYSRAVSRRYSLYLHPRRMITARVTILLDAFPSRILSVGAPFESENMT
jgi:hypothetical protein